LFRYKKKKDEKKKDGKESWKSKKQICVIEVSDSDSDASESEPKAVLNYKLLTSRNLIVMTMNHHLLRLPLTRGKGRSSSGQRILFGAPCRFLRT